MVDYQKILRRAWMLTKTNKFLWLFGLFLFLGNLVNIGYVPPDQQQRMANLNPWIGLGILVIIIFLFLLYCRSKAGSILAIRAVLEKKETSFSLAFAQSARFYWREFGALIF